MSEERKFQIAFVVDGTVAEVLSADDLTRDMFLNNSKVVDITDKVNSGEIIPNQFLGSFYHEATNTFRVAKPYPSWTWDNSISGWIAPTAMPNDEKDYNWVEQAQVWAEVGTESFNLEA
jgi:hypothetical protein